jgi:hypothetical protein
MQILSGSRAGAPGLGISKCQFTVKALCYGVMTQFAGADSIHRAGWVLPGGIP